MSLKPVELKPFTDSRKPVGLAHGPARIATCCLALAVLLICPATSFAYVGPGAGITALGALWALIATVFITLGGLLIWPIRAFLKRKKEPAIQEVEADSSEIAKTDSE